MGANLTCRAEANPAPKVWWSTYGIPAGPRNAESVERAERPLTEPQPDESILRLTDITESHEYTCNAENHLGRVYRNISVIVKGNEPIINVLENHETGID